MAQEAELFDNSFFAMSSGEANFTDPQQRLLLEQTYSTLAAANLDKSSLMGRRSAA